MRRARAGQAQDSEFHFPIFKSLKFDQKHDTYTLPAVAGRDRKRIVMEFTRPTRRGIYLSREGLTLIDRGNLKIVRAVNGTEFLFLQYSDGSLRCAAIKEDANVTLNLLYTANGLALHGVVDSSGRSLTFNYGEEGIQSLTQTWNANAEGLTRTWAIR